MAVSDKIIRAAARPDCLLAFFTCYQGMLLNPLISNTNMYPVPGSNTEGSWAYRNGLFQMTNITFSADGANSVNPNNLANLNFPLDLQGNNRNKTFIVRAYCPKNQADSLKVHPLISQGQHTGIISGQVFHFSLWEYPTSANLRGYANTGQASLVGGSSKFENHEFNQFHTFAMTVSFNSNATVKIQIFMNGSLRASFVGNGTSFATITTPSTIIPNNLAVRLDTTVKYIANNTVAWALVFDSALSESEIKALS